MKTPIFDFVKKYNEQNRIRLHMPGHKGVSVLGTEPLDITEIDGADVLYQSEGIISESQNNASLVFGTEKTLYSTEGSSLCIRAMLFLIKQYAISKNKKPLILAGRNAHKTFVTASALLDVDVSWLYSGQDEFLSCNINLDKLEEMLLKIKPIALYITSPDYLGNISDVEGIGKLCKKHDVLLLIDNAHGSYLKFIQSSLHPIDLGADMCCDSAHKTLPVLTGGAYLHISKTAPSMLNENAENALSMFASTSPSYLILQSLDLFNKIASNDFKERIDNVVNAVNGLKTKLLNKGFVLVGNEPLKVTIAPKNYGYTGFQLSKILQDNNIISEFSDPDFLVLMFSANTKISHIKTVYDTLNNVKRLSSILGEMLSLDEMECKLRPIDAIYAESEYVKTKDAVGRILAYPCVSCPPAVCVAVCGEQLNASAVRTLLYYGTEKVLVVKK